MHVTEPSKQQLSKAVSLRCCTAPQQSKKVMHSLLQEAASNGAKLVVLPEMWNCPYSNDSFPTYAGKQAYRHTATDGGTVTKGGS
jgi:omega-amidase